MISPGSPTKTSLPSVVDDADLDADQRPADGADRRVVLAGDDHAGGGLGQAVALEDPHAETARDVLNHPVGDHRCAGHGDSDGRQRVIGDKVDLAERRPTGWADRREP